MRNQLIDASLTALSCAFAQWLREHKELEPDKTYQEVVFGVGYTLVGALLKRSEEPPTAYPVLLRRILRDWHVWSAFLHSAIPIIVGEVAQAKEAGRVLALPILPRRKPKYADSATLDAEARTSLMETRLAIKMALDAETE